MDEVVHALAGLGADEGEGEFGQEHEAARAGSFVGKGCEQLFGAAEVTAVLGGDDPAARCAAVKADVGSALVMT
ncbi:hypothetical protein [Micromonospora sp. CA-244673]|uniref:hypothetical protein n=1 Tax=Micromonospora sp. CA-244673 TaxID=3239958 RepID=UPI003D940A3A